MSVIDEDIEGFLRCDSSGRAVVAGFGATGRLHLGHLSILYLYGTYRTMASNGALFVSDVGSFFSRDQTWPDTLRYREQILQRLSEWRYDEDVVLESDRLSSLLDWSGELASNDLGATLTLAAVRETADETDAILVLLGEDEQKYVEGLRERINPVADLSYVVVEDLDGPSGGKMSKSRPETCMYVDQIEDWSMRKRREWYERLSDQVSSIASTLELPDPTDDSERFSDLLAELGGR